MKINEGFPKVAKLAKNKKYTKKSAGDTYIRSPQALVSEKMLFFYWKFMKNLIYQHLYFYYKVFDNIHI